MNQHRRLSFSTCGALVGLLAAVCAADEVRFYQENGATYRETRRKVSRPVYETQWQERQVVRYREQAAGATREEPRAYVVPVVENRIETRLVGRWNPFVRQPYTVQKVVPTTRYEYRQTTVRVPITQRELIPETVTERVPIPVARMIEDEVVSRVAVNAPGGSPLPGAVATTWLVPGQPNVAAPAMTAGNTVAGNNVPWRPAAPTRR